MRHECRRARRLASSWDGLEARTGGSGLGLGPISRQTPALASSLEPLASSLRRRRRSRRDQQVLLVPDEVALAVDRELVVFPHEDRADRAGFFAVTAEDAAGLVDLVDRRVARAGLDGSVVLGRLQINRV